MKLKILLPGLFLILFILTSCNENIIRVVCLGDSITNGGGEGAEAFYPTQLDKLLGDEYEVLNCGESGATMLKESNKPFWKQKDLPNIFVYQPDIVVILLGTNDSKGFNWNAKRYEEDYQAMIDTLQSIPSHPELYLCLPPPAYKSAWEISDSTIQTGVIPIVKRLAEKNDLSVIDFNSEMTGMPGLFPDGIHPNEEGKSLMAEIVAKELLK